MVIVAINNTNFRLVSVGHETEINHLALSNINEEAFDFHHKKYVTEISICTHKKTLFQHRPDIELGNISSSQSPP